MAMDSYTQEQHRHMTIASKVKTFMIDYQEKHGTLPDDEYEALFVKMYVQYMNEYSLMTPPKVNHKKNGIR